REDLIYEVPMGVKDRKPLTAREIFEDHPRKEGGLARTGGADHVHVPHAEIARQAHAPSLALVRVYAYRHTLAQGLWRDLGFAHLSLECREAHRLMGQMHESSEF